MKNINIKQIQAIIKKNRINLTSSIIFLVISLMLLVWALFILLMDNSNSIFLHDMIVEESVDENVSVKVELTAIPYLFAEYSDQEDSNKYYFLIDSDYLYIGYLDHRTYSKLKDKDFEEEKVIVEGITKEIPDDIIDLAIQVYNREKGEVFLTEENYKSYIGNICLDTTIIDKDARLQIVFAFISFIVGIAMGFLYLKQYNQIRRTVSTYTDSEWKQIEKQFNDNIIISNTKMDVYFTDDYIVDTSCGLCVLRYSDIVWAYPYQLRQYGLILNQSIIIYDKNKKKMVIASINSSSVKIQHQISEFISLISKKNPKVLVGYTKDNCKRFRCLK